MVECGETLEQATAQFGMPGASQQLAPLRLRWQRSWGTSIKAWGCLLVHKWATNLHSGILKILRPVLGANHHLTLIGDVEKADLAYVSKS